MSFLRLSGRLTIGTVVPSSSSTILLRGRMASMCRSQKSQPKIASVANLSTTYKVTISLRLPISQVKLTVPMTFMLLLFASLIFTEDLRGLIRLSAPGGKLECRMKLEPAPVSNMTTYCVVARAVIPKYACTL